MNPYTLLGLNKKECLLPRCWICESNLSLELHHVIMRAHGGDNWPTVNLCADHHSQIHKIAILIEGRINTNKDSFLSAFTQICSDQNVPKKLLTKIKKLVTILLTAKDLCCDDRNKSIAFSDRFPPDITKKLRSLAVLHNSSQKTIVRAAIAQMYGKYFT